MNINSFTILDATTLNLVVDGQVPHKIACCAAKILRYLKNQLKWQLARRNGWNWVKITIAKLGEKLLGEYGDRSIRTALLHLRNLGLIARQHIPGRAGKCWEYQVLAVVSTNENYEDAIASERLNRQNDRFNQPIYRINEEKCRFTTAETVVETELEVGVGDVFSLKSEEQHHQGEVLLQEIEGERCCSPSPEEDNGSNQNPGKGQLSRALPITDTVKCNNNVKTRTQEFFQKLQQPGGAIDIEGVPNSLMVKVASGKELGLRDALLAFKSEQRGVESTPHARNIYRKHPDRLFEDLRLVLERHQDLEAKELAAIAAVWIDAAKPYGIAGLVGQTVLADHTYKRGDTVALPGSILDWISNYPDPTVPEFAVRVRLAAMAILDSRSRER